jgi:hypothetical protein
MGKGTPMEGDTELIYGFRIRRILEASGTSIQGIDQDAWTGFSGLRGARSRAFP